MLVFKQNELSSYFFASFRGYQFILLRMNSLESIGEEPIYLKRDIRNKVEFQAIGKSYMAHKRLNKPLGEKNETSQPSLSFEQVN